MEAVAARRLDRLAETLRKLVRRGARPNIKKLLGKMRPGDVAIVARAMAPPDRFAIFRVLIDEYPDQAGDVLTDLETSQRVELLEKLELEEIAGILRRLAVDDAVFLVESLPSNLRERVEELVDLRRDLGDVQVHLTYEDDTAGRLMDSAYFALPQTTSVGEAIAAIQSQQQIEMIFYLYVVDDEGRLVGVTSLRQLILSPPSKLLSEIMQRDLIQVHTSTDQSEVAQLAARYDLLAIPVVDVGGRLVGIITVDDIVDVVKEEAAEEVFKMAGSSSDELLYQDRSWRVAGIRLPWLLVNLLGGLATGGLLAYFQFSFKEALFLLTFVPVIMGTGGNGGTQTSTITVRGLATGRIGLGQGRLIPFLVQQLKVGAYLGLATGVVVGVIAVALERNAAYGLVVGGALFFALVLSSLNGALIPIFFERFGIDPAVAAGPLVTTSSDLTGILVYFGLAGLLIDRLVQ